MAHVVMRVGENLIESVITKRSADEMKLKVGDKVSAVKSPPKSCWKRIELISFPRAEGTDCAS